MQRTIGNLFMAALTLATAVTLMGQSFPSGSTGADGDLIVNTPGVTTFSATPAGGGSVYNFKTIQIAAGSTLRLSGAVLAAPLYFLAQGAVTIAGTIDLSGQNGQQSTFSSRSPSVPGSGGYGGGAGSYSNNAPQPGLGPAGGAITGCDGRSNYAVQGGFTGNQFLVPLVGGSGGGGGSIEQGGAGGGALLIASSVSITVNGTITANGGSSFYAGGNVAAPGAGGAIRLVAPTVAGNGNVTAAGGVENSSCEAGASGIVRMEAYQLNYAGSTGGTLYLATPVNLFLPATTAQPSILVTSIGGVAVPTNPTGSFTVPDVMLNSSSPLTVNIQALNIPVGTTASVYFSTENFPDQKITSTPLAATTTPGTTTATATVTLNPGYSLGYIIATWTQ